MSSVPIVAAAGLAVGLLVGLTGVGGSAVMTPLLLLGLGLPPRLAVGTDLIWATATKIAGGYQHARLGTVDWPRVRWLLAGSLPAGAFAALLAVRPEQRSLAHFDLIVGRALGAVLIAVAVVLLAHSLARTSHAGRTSSPTWACERWLLAAGSAVVSMLVLFTSVGSGSLLFALVALLSPLPTPRIVGTEMAHGALLSVVGGITHLYLGNVVWSLLTPLLCGALPGVWLGSRLSVRVSDRWLRRTAASLLFLAGLQLV